uniref:Protein kinase domain-containing protein n=1 Tax=Arcella intermedia TaxID=1963864 RepID=A0A6B2LAN0_9EUKA
MDTIIIGSFSKTRLVKYRKTNKLYALKSMNRSTIYEYKQLHHIYNEKSILSSITHPGIPRLYTTFSHRTSVHCLMEFVPGGELFTHIRRSGKLEGTTCKFYVAELVVLLEFLHERHIVFRDIKPENLLLDLRGHIKLYDFTFAKQLNEGRTYTICGTPDYMAPEILNGQPYSLEVDWWSLGVLMFEMMTGYPPFDTRNEISPPSRDPAGIVFPKYINPLALDLMKRLLVVEPEKRIGAKDVMELKSHPWFFQEPAIHWMEITKWSGEGPINLAPLTSFYDHYPEDENTDFEDEEQNVDLPKEVSDFFDSF